jgi:flagellar motility protein MotE (MotC chaperone)
MKQNYISVPFKSSSPNGFKEYNGIAKFSPAGIIFEFESKFFGLVQGEIKEVRVGLDEILDIKFRKGFYKFLANIQLRLKNFTKLAELPNDSGKVKLKIKREDFELAEEAFEQILQFMNGVDTRTLQESNNLNEQLPPAQTSVNELFDTEKLRKKDSKETNKLEG